MKLIYKYIFEVRKILFHWFLIIPHCVILFCTWFDIGALFHLEYNRDLHQIKTLDVFVQPSLPVLLNKIVVMSATSLTVDISKHGWKLVQVAMTTLYLVPSFWQYQFVLDFILLSYSAFTRSSPAFMTCMSIIFCLVTYMVLIIFLQYTIPLWLDIQYLLQHIFHSEQV